MAEAVQTTQPPPQEQPAGTTPPSSTTNASSNTEPAPASWEPYKPDPSKSANENLALKEAHDKTAPAGHDPNTPFKAAEKPAEKPAAEPAKVIEAAAPLTLTDIPVPEGFELDPAMGTEFVTALNQHRSDPKALVKALVDLQVKVQKTASETASRAWDKQQEDWKKATEADPEIGGAKYSTTTAQSKELVTRFGGPKFQELLEMTGMGNHPEFHRFMNKVAPFLREARPVPPGTPASGEDKPSSINLYPKQKG